MRNFWEPVAQCANVCIIAIMGLFRKMTAVSTLGAVSPRSTKEKQRLASAKESKANAQLAKAQTRALRRRR